MAFDLRHFQFNRGIISANAQGGGLTPVIHTYYTLADTLATVATPGYFPPFIDGSPDKVFPNDSIYVVTDSGTGLFRILTVNPITLDYNTLVTAPVVTGATIFPYSGPFTSTTFGSVDYQKVGNLVTVRIVAVPPAAASVSAPIVSAVSPLPAGFRPFADYRSDLIVTNNSVRASGAFKIDTLGVVTVYASIADANFIAAGTAGFFDAVAFYTGF